MQGIILVYDITNQQSFLHISKWASDVDEVRQEVFHLPVLYCDPVFQIRVVREYQSELQDTLCLCFCFFMLPLFAVCSRQSAEDADRKQVR